jgi:lipid-binding SYLF domain-containing protein
MGRNEKEKLMTLTLMKSIRDRALSPRVRGGLIMGLITGTAMLLGPSAARADDATKEAGRARKAVEVLDSILKAPDREVPEELLAKAYAVAVIPNMVKGAFLAGGSYGKGLVASRGRDGAWSTPAFVDIGGGSFGLQIGVEATDLVLVFTRPDGLDEMLKDNLKLGVEAAAVAGPVGRHVEAGSNFTFDSPIYAYSRNKGVFAGVALDGSILSIDDSSNHEVYGKSVSGTDILVRKTVHVSPVTRPFVDVLTRLVPRLDLGT